MTYQELLDETYDRIEDAQGDQGYASTDEQLQDADDDYDRYTEIYLTLLGD